MATFVLVHGAWNGSYYWKRLVPLMREAGHEVYTPTLTGLGERVHLANPDVDLETHIADISMVLQYEDLRDVVLVGHSYGGIVVTGVADRAPDRLKHLVYLDATVPVNGTAFLDVQAPEERATREEQVRQQDGWRLPPPVLPPAVAQRWPFTLMTPQPFKTMTQPLRLRDPEALARLPKTYILCSEDKNLDKARRDLAARGVHGPGWHYHEVPSGHFPMLTLRRELAALLSETVEAPAAREG